MNEGTLAHIIGQARYEADERGEHIDDICVTLNRGTFIALQNYLVVSGLEWRYDEFNYMGAIVSWSPMHRDPDGYAIGKYWKGAR